MTMRILIVDDHQIVREGLRALMGLEEKMLVVGEAHNEVLSSNDPTAHAELLAVRRASATLKSFNLAGCELYTNGAPCCMCMSSMLWGRIDRAYYVLSMDDSRSIGLGDDEFYAELARPLERRQVIPMVQEPELRQEARAVYELWAAKPDKVQF